MVLYKRSSAKIVTLYSRFLAVLPLVSIYSSGIPGINVGELILIMFFLYSIVGNRKGRYNKSFDRNAWKFIVIFCMYLITIPILVCMLEDKFSLSDMLIRTARLIFYFVIVLYISKKYFDYKMTMKWIVNISILAVIYLFIQYLSYYNFHIILKGYIPAFKLYTTAYETNNYSLLYTENFYRPTSFFLEPAHCARYIILGLISVLFSNTLGKSRLLLSLLISVGILLTTSGQGLLLLSIVWIFYLSLFIRRVSKSKILENISLISIGAFALYILSKYTDTLQNTLSRVFTGTIQSNNAIGSRLSSISVIFQRNLFDIIFGQGYGTVPSENLWMSGLTYVLFGAGLIGAYFIVSTFISCFRSGNNEIKIICLVFFLLFITDDAFNSYMIVLYLSLMIYGPSKERAEIL